MLGSEKEASRTFLEKVLREDRDKAFLIHFDRDVELLQELTSSRKQLEAALELLEMPRSGRRGGMGPGAGTGRRRGAGGTSLYDSVLLACDCV